MRPTHEISQGRGGTHGFDRASASNLRSGGGLKKKLGDLSDDPPEGEGNETTQKHMKGTRLRKIRFGRQGWQERWSEGKSKGKGKTSFFRAGAIGVRSGVAQ